MKSCSVTEETYIAKYHTEEQKLSQMREKLENFQKEKIRVQEQLLQIKKKLKSKRMEQGEFALLEKEVQTLETETTEENKSFGAVRKELEQMKTAWKEKENVCVLLEKIHHKLDILSELEGLFRGKRFVEYISRYYLEHIAREADTGLKEMTGNTYGWRLMRILPLLFVITKTAVRHDLPPPCPEERPLWLLWLLPLLYLPKFR